MHIHQFVAESLGDSSYLVVSDGIGAVIDPQRDIRPILQAAAGYGASLSYVLETHVHNDYVSGGRELAALGAEVLVPAGSDIEFPHRELGEGQALELGVSKLVAVRAPGHTYEHTAYLAARADGSIQGAFTGGSLLMASAGRTDLLGPERTDELTRLQWETAHRLRALVPGEADILPTHGAGSFCSATGTGAGRSGPMEVELRRNPALTAPTFERFREAQLASAAPIPAYYRYMAPINRHGPKVHGLPPSPQPMTSGDFATLPPETVRIDVRRRADFAAGHLPGTLEIEESDTMLAYTSWLTEFNAPVALVAYNQMQADRVATDLFRIGYERVVGWVDITAADRLDQMPTVNAEEAAAVLKRGKHAVVDVRYASEHAESPVAGALELPFNELTQRAEELPEGPVVVFCASGQRATIAASYLRGRGMSAVPLIDGGAEDVRRELALT
ncbi:MAG TPA: MBL fold metallo-hydrolase [Tepidiformaceae bacterium]|nr:MBL fold metallo-hydrolase [Tepidiformaceae bacterium]